MDLASNSSLWDGTNQLGNISIWTFETIIAQFFIPSFTPKHLWRVSGVTLRAPDQRVLCRRWPLVTSCSVSQREPRPHCQGPCQIHIMTTVWTHESSSVWLTLIHRDLRAVASLWHSRGQVYSSLGPEPAIHRLSVDILCGFGLGVRYTRPLFCHLSRRDSSCRFSYKVPYPKDLLTQCHILDL